MNLTEEERELLAQVFYDSVDANFMCWEDGADVSEKDFRTYTHKVLTLAKKMGVEVDLDKHHLKLLEPLNKTNWEGGPPYDAATATGMYDHD